MSEDRFQIGAFWLSKQSNSPVWRATWFDADARQTRRASLGTQDFQEAQIALAEFVVKKLQPENQIPAEMPLSLTFLRYWDQYACKIASADQAKYALALWVEFWGPASIADLKIQRQEDFILWLKSKGYKNSYVSRVLSVGRAAVYRAWKRGEITSKPFIMDETDRSDEKETYVLDIYEMRRLLIQARNTEHLFIFCMVMLNTLARPDAVLDLAPAQINLTDKRINLNPKGRKQTNKYRPIVPLTETLLPFVRNIECSRLVMWWGKPIDRIDGAFAGAVERGGLPSEITPYSLRHTMATELRRRSVSPWEVEGMLGHRRPGVTEKYAHFAPDFMSDSRKAIDAYFAELGPILRPDTEASVLLA